MRAFAKITELAIQRLGIETFERMLEETRPLAPSNIAAIPDDRILSAMARRVFYSGFSSKVVDAKWDAFEEAFDGFDPTRCAWNTEERLDELLKNREIVRNGAKIRSVQANGRFVMELAKEHGSAARFFAEWPDTDYVSLLALLKKRGSRLGGETGMRFLRSIGKPTFIPTRDVSAALMRENVLTRSPSGRGDYARMQAAFNEWSAESGLDLTSISRTLAMSVD